MKREECKMGAKEMFYLRMREEIRGRNDNRTDK
jgi:hypothetical protein